MNPSIEEKWAAELLESRKRLKREMLLALACRTKKQKIDLVNRWKREYSPISVSEMLRCARNKTIAGDIAHWDLESMK